MPAEMTKTTDLVIPEILAAAVAGGFSGMAVLAGSGAAIVNDTLPSSARGGNKVVVPYFGTIGDLEDVAEGDPLTAVKLDQTGEDATVGRAGRLVEMTQFAIDSASPDGDPYEEASRQIIEAVRRHADAKLVASAAATTLAHDITSGSAKTISWDAVIDAKTKWGDEQDDIALMVVHSKIWGDLCKLRDSGGKPLAMAVNDGALDRFAGIPVVKSDRLPVAAGKYTSLLLKRNSVVWWFNKTPSIDTDKDIARDTQLLSMNVYGVAHMYKRMPGLSKPGVVKLITEAGA